MNFTVVIFRIYKISNPRHDTRWVNDDLTIEIPQFLLLSSLLSLLSHHYRIFIHSPIPPPLPLPLFPFLLLLRAENLSEIFENRKYFYLNKLGGGKNYQNGIKRDLFIYLLILFYYFYFVKKKIFEQNQRSDEGKFYEQIGRNSHLWPFWIFFI